MLHVAKTKVRVKRTWGSPRWRGLGGRGKRRPKRSEWLYEGHEKEAGEKNQTKATGSFRQIALTYATRWFGFLKNYITIRRPERSECPSCGTTFVSADDWHPRKAPDAAQWHIYKSHDKCVLWIQRVGLEPIVMLCIYWCCCINLSRQTLRYILGDEPPLSLSTGLLPADMDPWIFHTKKARKFGIVTANDPN